MGSLVTGSEHWACGWQNYTVSGWVYPYNQEPIGDLPIKIDKNGQEYIRFVICTPRMFGKHYYFFPVTLHGKNMCKSIQKVCKYGDFVEVIGYWDERKVKLASYNGKTRLRQWCHIVATRINKMPHVRSRQEIEKLKNEIGTFGLPRTFDEIKETITKEDIETPFN